MTKILKYEPDYASAPGATLKEILDERGISQSNFALRAGMTEKTISQIINGMAPISVETADKFQMVLGIPATFWNRRELAYRESVTRAAELKKLESEVAWLKEVPVNELVKRKFVKKTSDKTIMVRQVLEFFGVSSVDAWRNVLGNTIVQFRGGEAHKKYPGFVAAWRRIGVLAAQRMRTAQFDAQEFKSALNKVRSLTREEAVVWRVKMPELCACAGVAVVLVEEIPNASISGMARWLNDKPMIQLSLKYRRDDQFWFTFFHEAGHILLHGRKQVFVDYGFSTETEEEREANEFARDFLIPPQHAKRLGALKTRAQIRQFAESIGIAPGIVVGRMQYDEIAYQGAFNDLKRTYKWDNEP